MKKIFLSSILIFNGFLFLKSQSTINLSGKSFKLSHNTPGSTAVLTFKSNTQINYIITSNVGGKTYVDDCPGKASINGNSVAIECNCTDKEIYPDPIKDSYTYDSKTQSLTSTKWRSTDGKYFIWNLK